SGRGRPPRARRRADRRCDGPGRRHDGSPTLARDGARLRLPRPRLSRRPVPPRRARSSRRPGGAPALVSVRDVITHGDFEAFAGALAPDIVWVGVSPGLLCRNREQVIETMHGWIEQGHGTSPEIVGERENLIVVDPHVDPPNWIPELHHVFVVESDRIVE